MASHPDTARLVPSAGSPGISVVIVTRNCSRHVRNLLASLQPSRQGYTGESEVIIVDDSSSDAERAQMAALGREFGARLLAGNASVSAKRNLGAEQAAYPIVLFLDSDCIASPDLLQQHARIYEDPAAGACLGPVDFCGPASWLWRSVELTPYVIPFQFGRIMPACSWGPTANFSVRREAFLQVRGFDTTFPPRPGGEDVELGLRLTKAGCRIHCNPAAVVQHTRETWSSLRSMTRRLNAWGRAEYYLMERHPEMIRPAFPRFTVVFGLVVIASVLLATIRLQPSLLLLPLLWAAVYVGAFSLASAWRFARGWADVLPEVGALCLLLSFELGAAAEFVRHRRFDLLGGQMIYTSGQLVGEWAYGSLRVWIIILATLTVAGLSLI